MRKISFTLTTWYLDHKRDLPWRRTNDPYLIWLSEIILQQTRVDQGLAYYLKFTSTFPTIQDLAAASEDQVLKLWQGLGYYSRARNLHFTAKLVTNHYNGVFPSSYKELLKLKGVGSYTAAAIASFCFNEPQAVLDGNVFRVLSRLFNIYTPIDTPLGKKEFHAMAQELLNKKKPALHNQAIMELGALVCTPKQPKCSECPLNDQCDSIRDNSIDLKPVKSKKIKIRVRFFYYLHISHGNEIYLSKRGQGDIWQNLYEFPLIEATTSLTPHELQAELNNFLGERTNFKIDTIYPPVKHLLTHQKIFSTFISLNYTGKKLRGPLLKIPQSKLEQYAIPTLIDNYLKNR